MRRIATPLLALLLGSVLLLPAAAHAVLITVNFTVAGAGNDPVNAGVTASGWFTYDPANVPPGGGAAGSFETDLAFIWDGTTYTKDNADLYFIFVDANGYPTDWRLNAPWAANTDGFYFGPSYNSFRYHRGENATEYQGTLVSWSYVAAPAAVEPGTLSLLGLGLLPLGMIRRRRRN